MITQAPGGEVLVYETPDGGPRVDVRLERETVWLRQEQMSQLFGRERSVISKHIRNAFAEGELDQKSNVQNLHIAGSDKPVRFYSLDVIISVGYRVKSVAGTRFRQWATRTLRDHLVQGYAVNRQRFEHNAREWEAALALVRKAAAGEGLSTDQGRGLAALRGNLEHSVFGEPAYPTVESKAAHLLYFVIKNHPFADGNKPCCSGPLLRRAQRNYRCRWSRSTPNPARRITRDAEQKYSTAARLASRPTVEYRDGLFAVRVRRLRETQ